MDASRIERIESIAEHGAFLILGGAVAFAVYMWLARMLAPTQLLAGAAGAGLLTVVVCNGFFRSVAKRRPQFAVPVFDIREFDAFQPDELVLTDRDRLSSEPAELVLTEADRVDSDEALVLDDILAEMSPDSRVVRLFDRSAMPSPGQLRSRIDDHLGQSAPPRPASDDSQALSDALAELRRSLR